MRGPFGRIAAAALIGVVWIGLPSRIAADVPDAFTPWSAPVNLGRPISSTVSEFFASFSKDGQSLYLTIATCPLAGTSPCFADPNASGGFDIYVSQWDTVSRQWGTPR